jgi:hypothetical protein
MLELGQKSGGKENKKKIGFDQLAFIEKVTPFWIMDYTVYIGSKITLVTKCT